MISFLTNNFVLTAQQRRSFPDILLLIEYHKLAARAYERRSSADTALS